jgi:hypothetical protein
MLKEKTKGNLTAEEERMLKDVLMELKLNYVDEVKKVQAEQPKQEGEQKNS